MTRGVEGAGAVGAVEGEVYVGESTHEGKTGGTFLVDGSLEIAAFDLLDVVNFARVVGWIVRRAEANHGLGEVIPSRVCFPEGDGGNQWTSGRRNIV